MPYIEHDAEITLFGETVDVPLWVKYQHHDRIPEARESGGLAISPAEPAHCEIHDVKIIVKYGKATPEGYAPPVFAEADWLLDFLTSEQRGEIEQAIAEELE